MTFDFNLCAGKGKKKAGKGGKIIIIWTDVITRGDRKYADGHQ